MHIVAVAWIFVVVLMTLTEATSTQGTVMGALFTLLLYGVLPLGIVLYVMGTPLRARTRKAAEAAEAASATPSAQPSAQQRDGSGHATGARVSPEREEA